MMLLKKEKNNFISKEILHMIVYGDSTKIEKICNREKRGLVKRLAWTYSTALSILILVSLGTLIFNIETLQEHPYIFVFAELATFSYLVIDFGLRWYTSDIEVKKGKFSFYLFPFRPLSILMILQLLPGAYIFDIITDDNSNPIWVVLRVFKLTRIMRIIMNGTLFSSLTIFRVIIRKNRAWLFVVIILIILIILTFASGVYTAEISYYAKNHITPTKSSIISYWESIYYCSIAITTIGFGDIAVLSDLGRTLTIFMSFLGLIILTFPAGILAGSFMTELKNQKEELRKWTTSEKYINEYESSTKWYEFFIIHKVEKIKLKEKLMQEQEEIQKQKEIQEQEEIQKQKHDAKKDKIKIIEKTAKINIKKHKE